MSPSQSDREMGGKSVGRFGTGSTVNRIDRKVVFLTASSPVERLENG